MIRSLRELRETQKAILDEFREQLPKRDEEEVTEPGADSTPPLTVYGRVSSVVTSDPDHGPNLIVARQRWSGTPPTVSDLPGVTTRCYPTPNRSVTDYSVDEYVRVVTAYGAMIAEKLA